MSYFFVLWNPKTELYYKESLSPHNNFVKDVRYATWYKKYPFEMAKLFKVKQVKLFTEGE